MRKNTLLLLGLVLSGKGMGQDQFSIGTMDSTATQSSSIALFGFADAYWGIDAVSKNRQRPYFLYSHSRSNELALNNAILGVRYTDEQVRGSVALHAGTYVEANYASEPQSLRHVYEAYAGFRPVPKTWLDLGIFQSHIGFESAISKDNWTLTRSLMAENSPYYEAGARLCYEPNTRISFTALVLNGWQNLRDNNRAKALGTQVLWKPNRQLAINSSTFFGNEQPQDSTRRRRIFHNAYVSYAATPRLALAVVFDVGWQQRELSRSAPYDVWYTGAAFLRYRLSSKWSATVRGEFYRAARGVVIRSVAPRAAEQSVRLAGASVNCDYAPSAMVLCRLEGRVLRSAAPLFEDGNNSLRQLYANITSSIAISF
ncbi:porin [Hymenobacter latericus]|uniref:porin n=1 Tax=Hymenobacter sp. YIM 151858-1 TaxID=2987688 RepID=UPI0022260B28|nr:porin [Hymenobacter sp. YIM 151858-1]UYZ60188.1 porin [Hymenobacter sp. YIM 151858-1]